ncbi:unnamed protein product [Scytosiphon promiscuus]
MWLSASLAAVLGTMAMPHVQAATCPVALDARVVSTTEEASELSEALLCSGAGEFEVEWQGQVLLERPILISNGSYVKVAGANAEEAVIDGGDAVVLFNVGGGSTLELDGLSLVRGVATYTATYSYGGGGAVILRSDDCTLTASGCSFIGNNAIDTGGAITSKGSNVTLDGDTTFADNSAGEFGGETNGVRAGGIITIDGTTAFTNNSAGIWGGDAVDEWYRTLIINGKRVDEVNQDDLGCSDFCGSKGGAVYNAGDGITIHGTATFDNNTAENWGGAIYTEGNTAIDGDITFSGNTAGTDGGAVYSASNNITFDGATIFGYNQATSNGGALYLGGADLEARGTAHWIGNAAGGDGGALYMGGGATSFAFSVVDASFTNNTAGADGGAIAVAGGSSLSIIGPIPFRYNKARENGGAVVVRDSTIATQGGTMFDGNVADGGAGGGVYCSSTSAVFNGSVFSANEALWGGGLALFSSGSLFDDDEPGSGFVNTTMCVFQGNSAVDGGAVYSAAGYDEIKDCLFEDNLAVGSGGAYLHSGVLVELDRSTFVGNRAGDAGPAVQSLGIAGNITDTTFESNTYYCSSEQYGYEDEIGGDEVSDTCRFGVVCSSCAASCEDIPGSVVVVNDAHVPICESAMTGVNTSGDGGVTLSELNLLSGYYRTSAESQDVLKCYQEEACVGGTDVSQYCREGYRGAYCAVCEEGYASGYQFSCSSCDGENLQSAIGTSVALFFVALVVLGLVIADLVRVVDELKPDTTSSCGMKLTYCRDRVVKAVPLTSIKIVVVAWQIVTQFSSVVNVVYPDIYASFLAVLNAVNFDLGFLLSISCIVDINFYGRLFFTTIGPLVVFGGLAATYAVSRSRNRHSPAGMQAAKSKHLSIALFISFVVYSSVSFNIFQTFVCETLDDGVKYLRADYSLTCSAGVHKAMMAYAGLMILVYPVGIPAVYSWWLLSNRHDLVKVGAPGSFSRGGPSLNHLQPMRDLWSSYKPRRYYFEVLECGRRIALTGLAAFLLPDSAAQVAIEVVLAAIFMAVSDVLSPFADPFDGWLYRTGAWIVFFSMYLALLLKVDASDEDSQSQAAFAKVLIAAHVGMVLVVLVQAVLSVRRGLVTIRDQPAANRSVRRSSFAQGRDGETAASELEPQWS